MPRKHVPILPGVPYHINARGWNREWFDLSLETVWSIMEDYLYLVCGAYDFRVHAFVLMSNHFHMLASTSRDSMSEALLYFMRETSREINRLSGRINQTYGARNHKTYLGNYHYFMNSYKYVYQNPVRAGLCKRVEEYPYSTLHGLLGLKRLIIPLAHDTILLPQEMDQSALSWLNTRPSVEDEEQMRLALRRAEFALKTCRKTGKKSELETRLI